MRTSYWERIAASGFAVPGDNPLSRLTAELTDMLGSSDPHLRHDLAVTTLTTWLADGIYDGELSALGDALADGLSMRLRGSGLQPGSGATAPVFRRSYHAMALGACLARDREIQVLSRETVLSWANRLATWFLAETDLRGYVRGYGWAHALGSGASVLGDFSEHPLCRPAEQLGLLDVLAERFHVGTSSVFRLEDLDQMARLTLRILRSRVEPVLVQAWLHRIGSLTFARDRLGQPAAMATNSEGFLRCLYLAMTLAGDTVPDRGDHLIAVIEVLRDHNAAWCLR